MKMFRMLKLLYHMKLSNVKMHIFSFSKSMGNKLLVPIFVVPAE